MPETKRSEFLPATVNQTPPKTPNCPLKLYSMAGAKLSCCLAGAPTRFVVVPENEEREV